MDDDARRETKNETKAAAKLLAAQRQGQRRQHQLRILIGSTLAGVVFVLVWKYASVLVMVIRQCFEELWKTIRGHPVVCAAVNGAIFVESWHVLKGTVERKLVEYAEAAKSLFALLYWMVRGAIWYVSEVDIHDSGAYLQKVATDVHDWALNLIMLYSQTPDATNAIPAAMDTLKTARA